MWGISSVNAQSARIHHTITKDHKVAPAMGRDLWLGLPQNYIADLGGKYFYLYVTSPKTTTVHVETSMGTLVKQIQAYKVAAFACPLGWEIKTNNIIEDKAIHVYSKDADITVYEMSHNSYTSDGMYVIPSIGWGNDYVVAAYAALDCGLGGDCDEPSEFVVVSNQDHTHVTITPSNPLRGQTPTSTAYPENIPFEIEMQRGQTIQFKSVEGIDVEREDVTGTVVHSDKPVGVIGASQCPDVPLGYPWCDAILDMCPPTRTWAKSYYTTPFQQRLNGDTFLLIGTKDGQQVYTTDASVPRHPYCVLEKNKPFWAMEQKVAAKWESDAPFFLVQYINSASWDCPQTYNCSLGDPAEVVINPIEQYAKKVIFQTPSSQGSQSPYVNYVNVIVNAAAASKSTFDDHKITNYPKLQIDGKYEVYRVNGVTPGAHTVISDSGVGVYIYGYGAYESYAWTGSFGTGTFGSLDTLPPNSSPFGACYTAHIPISDPDTGVNHSKLGLLRVDSIYNMGYTPDPAWVEGKGIDSTYYDIIVVDPSKEAIIVVSAFDLAGNQITITSTYTPISADALPLVQNLGKGNIGGAPIYTYDTLINTGKNPFPFTDLYLMLGNQGFSIDSADRSPLAVGEHRKIKIKFVPVVSQTVSDTIIFGDDCNKVKMAVIGNGGAADFYVEDQQWSKVPLFGPPVTKPVKVHNLSETQDIKITAIQVDSAEFTYDATALPLVVPKHGTAQVMFTFHPHYLPEEVSASHWTSPDVNDNGAAAVRNDVLRGDATQPSETFWQDTTVDVACGATDTVHLAFVLESTSSGESSVIQRVTHSNAAFINLRGVLQNGTVWDPTTGSQRLGPGDQATIYEDYPVPANTNATAIDYLVATNLQGDTITGKPLQATINTTYREEKLDVSSLDFGSPDYQGPRKSQSFIVTNTANSKLTISSVALALGGQYNNAYTITTNPPIPAQGLVMQPGDKMTVTVDFDPSVSFAASQPARIDINSDACAAQSADIRSGVSVHGATSTITPSTPILSCDQQVSTVTVYNLKPRDVNEDVTDEITAVNITGTDPTFFAISGNPTGTIIHGMDSTKLDVQFNPLPGGAPRGYSAMMEIHLHSARGLDTVLFRPLVGAAGNIVATARSVFATASNGTAEAYAGDNLKLPIDLAIDKGTLSTPLSTLNVNKIVLTYTIPNPNLVHVSDIAASMEGLPAGWSVDRGGSSFSGNTLKITLTGSRALDDADHSLGTLNMVATLSSDTAGTPVELVSMDMFHDNAAVGACASTKVESGNFNLIYRCGDESMQLVMSGNGSRINFIKPATPNPVSGSKVTFQYANRIETDISLAIYDALGKEVSRPVNNIHHEPGVWKVTSDVSSLSSGTYTYRLTGDKGVASGQFVIQR